MALGPFKICHNENIKGIYLGKKTTKIALYAEDVLFVEDLISSITAVIEQFGIISGYKIRIKSVFMGFNISDNMNQLLSEIMPARW